MVIRIIPVVQVIVTAGLMLLIAWLIPFGRVAGAWQWPLVVVLGVAGAGLILVCGLAFIRAKTTVHPACPEKTSALVVDESHVPGIFADSAGLGRFSGQSSRLRTDPAVHWI